MPKIELSWTNPKFGKTKKGKDKKTSITITTPEGIDVPKELLKVILRSLLERTASPAYLCQVKDNYYSQQQIDTAYSCFINSFNTHLLRRNFNPNLIQEEMFYKCLTLALNDRNEFINTGKYPTQIEANNFEPKQDIDTQKLNDIGEDIDDLAYCFDINNTSNTAQLSPTSLRFNPILANSADPTDYDPRLLPNFPDFEFKDNYPKRLRLT